jgi:hypothetical protein
MAKTAPDRIAIVELQAQFVHYPRPPIGGLTLNAYDLGDVIER